MDKPKRGRKRTEALIETRQRQMCDAAVSLFGRHGFHSTTMQKIATEAGVSVGLFYQYFKDKDDLLYCCILELLDHYISGITQATAQAAAPLERFKAGVHAYAAVIDRHRSTALLGYRESHWLGRERIKAIMKLEREANNLIRDLVAQCVEAGVFRGIDIEMFTYQIIIFVHSWALEAWRLPKQERVQDFVERGLQLMLPAVEMPKVKVPVRSR